MKESCSLGVNVLTEHRLPPRMVINEKSDNRSPGHLAGWKKFRDIKTEDGIKTAALKPNIRTYRRIGVADLNAE